MLIQSLPLNQLNPAKYNPRKISEKAKKGLAKAIEDFGMLQPIIVNKAKEGYTVVSGHQRLKVLIDQGYEEIECVIVELSEAREKKLNVLMRYGWSAEFHDESSIVCIEPPMKVTVFKDSELEDDEFFEDDMEVVEVIATNEQLDQHFQNVFGYVPKSDKKFV